jgi:hypothetical protein
VTKKIFSVCILREREGGTDGNRAIEGDRDSENERETERDATNYIHHAGRQE